MKTDTIVSTPKIVTVPARAWLVVALLCVVGCLNYLDRIMITTMRESIKAAIPMTDAQFGLLTAVFLWIYGLLSPYAGFLADRFNRSRVIIGSLFVWSLVTWLTAHATTFEELLLTRALMGISEACYIPAAMALIVDYHRGPTRSLATGIHLAGVMIGQSLGFLGGMIAENRDWSTAFSVFGLVGIGYAVVLALFLRDAPRPVEDETVLTRTEKPVRFGEAVRNLFSKPAFSLLLLFWALLGVVGWLVVGWLPTFYQEHFNLPQSQAGLYATGYFHTAALVGVLVGGALTDRISRNNPRGRILVPALALCIAAPAIFLASTTPVLAVAIVGFICFAFTRVFADTNMMPILCLIADERYRATGYGILNLGSCIVGGLSLYAGGALRDAQVSFSQLFQIATVLLLICAATLFWLKSQTRLTSSEQ
ncbi:sugar phosphate permease [Larkinella arboricola]|uniref:Sugar phosphate permease n=1 Tax=Larkinella arboricola TaxID=643671 RepID=A0A327WTE1_LARAB|nr:MFS transporter [Larkinella arboricola]RAJ94512.1 sugar phosphate permease [Larkinella arboricola]